MYLQLSSGCVHMVKIRNNIKGLHMAFAPTPPTTHSLPRANTFNSFGCFIPWS